MDQIKTFSKTPKIAKAYRSDLRNSRLDVVKRLAGSSNETYKYLTRSQCNMLDRYGIRYQYLSLDEREKVNQPRENYQKTKIDYTDEYVDAYWNN